MLTGAGRVVSRGAGTEGTRRARLASPVEHVLRVLFPRAAQTLVEVTVESNIHCVNKHKTVDDTVSGYRRAWPSVHPPGACMRAWGPLTKGASCGRQS